MTENAVVMDEKDVCYKHWQVVVDGDQVMWLSIDRHGVAVNTINVEVLEELELIITQVESKTLKGLVLQSAKSSGFIAGADIEQFRHLRSYKEALDLMRLGQRVFSRLEDLGIPSVALIDGFCLGGGCELALACTYRVAVDQPRTQIGLPEVKLGIHPGWGGSVRLPRQIGVMRAMPLILSGRALRAKAAYRLGVVQAAVPLRDLKRAAKYFINKKPPIRKIGIIDQFINQSWVRPLVARKMQSELGKKVRRSHYPSPFAVIDNWKKYGLSDLQRAYDIEARSIANCVMDPTAQRLVDVFFMQEKLKSSAKKNNFKPKHVHVIGAGVMGGDIAAWCAFRGMHVTLEDKNISCIAPAIKRAQRFYKKKLKKQRLVQAVMDRLTPDVSGYGLRTADVVIEAIYEDLTAKQTLFQRIESHAKAEAILASNTSSIPLESIAEKMREPSRLVGIHFFNPVAQMPLVEVVRSSQTASDVCSKSQSFVVKIAKLPLKVASRPGFLVNRVLMPYLMEAMRMFEEGVDPQVIDQAALDFGMPMGPIRLADQVGLDVCLSVGNNLAKDVGFEVPKHLNDLVTQGHLGCKSGQGFYRYKDGQALVDKKANMDAIPKDVTDRLVLAMLNEAVSCLDHQVVERFDELDAGMIFGTGFAPFRGGPIHYIRDYGVADIIARLEDFSKCYGLHFTPNKGWSRLLSAFGGADVENHHRSEVNDEEVKMSGKAELSS